MRWLARTTLVLVVAAALAALAGCAGTRKQMISEARPPVAAETVQVYYQRPADSVDIAWLEASSAMGFGTQGQHDAVIARLRREAASLGANGVVVMGSGRGPSPVGIGVGVGSWGSHGGASVGGGIPTTQQYVSGIAVWVPEGAIAAPPPPQLPTGD